MRNIYCNFIPTRFPSNIEAAVACEAPYAVCEWRKKIVGIKTPNMIASGILIKEGKIITNRHVVEDHKSILVKKFDGSVEKAEVIPHDIPVDLAIVTLGFNQTEPGVAEMLARTQSETLYVVAFDQEETLITSIVPLLFIQNWR